MLHPYRQAVGVPKDSSVASYDDDQPQLPHPNDTTAHHDNQIHDNDDKTHQSIIMVNDGVVGNGFGAEPGYGPDRYNHEDPHEYRQSNQYYNNQYDTTNININNINSINNINNNHPHNVVDHDHINSNDIHHENGFYPASYITDANNYSYPSQPSSPKFSTNADFHNQSLSKVQNHLLSPSFTGLKGNSPSTNSLSTNSSATNLNLNGLVDTHLSKSETNLLTPYKNIIRDGHTRSVSSTSSFIYDRNADTGSIIDFSQNIIQQYLGSNSTNLLPRIKTIELYRKNAKKSSDPAVIFQYAQYILQTALLLDDTPDNASIRNLTPNSTKSSPKQQGSKNSSEIIDEKKFKQALIKESIRYLRRLSDKGYAEAQYLLADAYSSGALGKVDNKEAFLLFVHAAKHGHVEAAYRTSYCYEEGLGTGRDARKSMEYLKIAASKNHPAAMYKLGIYSFYGRMGLSSDMDTKKMGIQWLTRASNIANELIAAAPFELGKIYFSGFKDIVIQDRKYALELYSQAAALGHIEAAAILGSFYESGDVVPQDGNLSIHYFTQAALGGDPDSMLSMCAWYLVGCEPHLPRDENEAFEWAKRAANCDLPKAQFALANFYEKGIGCIKDLSEAQNWYKKAAENGDEKSLERITDSKFVSELKLHSKKLKKKPSKNSNTAQDKDCIIM